MICQFLAKIIWLVNTRTDISLPSVKLSQFWNASGPVY